MKYNTRPIDYTGCHPVIAAYLKLGKAIECEVWDDEDNGHDKRKRYITGYIPGAYIMSSGVFWSHAEPTIPLKARRIMPPERAIPVLIAKGFKFNDDGDLCGHEFRVSATQFSRLGELVNNQGASCWEWPPCIVEEIDE